MGKRLWIILRPDDSRINSYFTHECGLWPAFLASSFELNHTRLFCLIFFAQSHFGIWYVPPNLLATNFPGLKVFSTFAGFLPCMLNNAMKNPATTATRCSVNNAGFWASRV